MKKMSRGFLRIGTRLVRPRNNRVLFYSGLRGYTCNPKYVLECMNDTFPGKYELCWIGKEKKEVGDRNYIKFIRYTPVKMLWMLLTSRVFVTNGTNSICPKSKNRLIVGTWHGTAYKKVGYDVGDQFSVSDAANSAIDVFLSVSREYTDHCLLSGFRFKGRILKSGYPRNDIFFDKDRSDKAAERVKKHYGLRKTVVLYAPTYRGGYQTANKICGIDFEKTIIALGNKYGKDFSLIVRMHYFDKSNYDIPNGVIDVADWPDMQELLCATDVLITDYSSTIWDFSFTGRKCILFVPDLKQYKKDRGLYTDPTTWPAVISENMDELISVLCEDEGTYNNKIQDYYNMVNSYEKGKASRLVCDLIDSYVFKHKMGAYLND